MKNQLLPLILSVFLLPVAASAATQDLVIGQSYSTGYDSSTSTALAPGATDLYFSLLSSTSQGVSSSSPVVASPVPSVWAVVPGAQFISPSEDQAYPTAPGSPEGNLPGTYTYSALLQTDFSTATSVTLTGSFAADNGATLQIDGFTVESVPAPAYGSATPFDYTFTLAGGALPLDTTIDFVVNNQDDTNGTINPTGVLVSNLKVVSNAVPEPSTWALMFGGLAMLFFVRRVRSFAKL
jgi:hypothetical protein